MVGTVFLAVYSAWVNSNNGACNKENAIVYTIENSCETININPLELHTDVKSRLLHLG